MAALGAPVERRRQHAMAGRAQRRRHALPDPASLVRAVKKYKRRHRAISC
jgi:hypothetical protein